jgi:hypothetical protein
MSLEITSINGMGSISISGSTVTTTGMKADDHMHIADDFIISQGILQPDHFLVEEMDTPGLGVKVAIGVAYILNPNWTDSSNTHQKFYRVKMDAELAEVAINANTAGNPRITSIFIKIDTSATPGDDGEDAVSIVAIDGTAAATPEAPATPVDGNAYLRLADVECADSFVSVLDADITDQRERAYLRAVDDGWIPANETWAYASATTITVPSGAASRYQKGMPFKLTANSVVLQGYIVGIADTVLTVVGDALTNHTFTDNYYAQSGTVPIGFQEWFDYTPTYGGTGSLTFTSVTTQEATYAIKGTAIHLILGAVGTTGGTASSGIRFTIPLAISTPRYFYCSGAKVSDSGAKGAFVQNEVLGGLSLTVYKYDVSNFGLGAAREIACAVTYNY